MQGTLQKWTNYISGWQSRWFVLEKGVLSYYRSEDDMQNGCKGSVKLAVCDVSAHSTDTYRLDLIIPGEQHFYLRAATQQERQQWLIALGSCKACLAEGKPAQTREENEESTLRSKRSELRLYCDLLLQQVHTVKSHLRENEIPDIEKMNEATSLLSATCDTFVATLESCMALVGARADTTSAPPSVRRSRSLIQSQHQNGDVSVSVQIPQLPSPASAATAPPLSLTFVANPGEEALWQPPVTELTETPSQSPASSASLPPAIRPRTPRSRRRVKTFFSAMSVSFEDIRLGGSDAEHIVDAVPTLPFLDACRSVVAIFDHLSATAFAPVKMDLTGNIRKIQMKYNSDPGVNGCLQMMMLSELHSKLHTNPNSASVAVLWLTRGLQFICAFLEEVSHSSSDVEDLSAACQEAYARSLRPYHGWVVRGVVALAAKALPYRSGFIDQLSPGSPSANPGEIQPGVPRQEFAESLLRDMKNYAEAVSKVTRVLYDFLRDNGLDREEAV